MRNRTLASGSAMIVGLALAGAAAAPAFAQSTIGSGHVDALAVSYDQSAEALQLQVEDHEGDGLQDPADVVFDVHNGHAQTFDEGLSCRADEGENWVIPRTEDTGLLWVGWSTEALDLAEFGGSIEAELVSVDAPDGGAVSVYDATTDTVRFHSDADCDAGSTAITESHHHATWVFTEPGTYRLTFQVSGDHSGAGPVDSGPTTYTFEVGGA